MQNVKFEVESVRRIPTMVEGIKNYDILCEIHNLPDSFSLGPNPRKQKEGGKVVEAIKESLYTPDSLFHLKNRGVLLTARSLHYTEESGRKFVEINFIDEKNLHGVPDGGHTYKQILKHRGDIEHEVYVKLEVITATAQAEEEYDLSYSLAGTRNTFAQVTDKALANLAGKFDFFKDPLSKAGLSPDVVSFTQFDEKPIDVKHVIALMTMFCYDFLPGKKKQKHPKQTYTALGTTEKIFLKTFDDYGDTIDNPYKKLYNILPDIISFANYIEGRLPEKWDGHYGKLAEVDYSEKKPYRKMFSAEEYINYKTPQGWFYPILAAFRQLVDIDDNTGYFKWVCNPIECFESVGEQLISDIVDLSKEMKNNPQTVGKLTGAWQNAYSTVKSDC